MTTTATDVRRRLWSELENQLSSAIELRHRLHADPRRSGDEADTAATVVAALASGEGTSVAGTGRLVRMGTRYGPSIGLRAELDALPIVEASDVPWSATGPLMHACGHDVHLAAVVAAARAITAADAPLPVTAVLQPREEGAPSGARDIVTADALVAAEVQAMIGAHVQPRLPVGAVGITPGLVNASVDEFEIVVTGRVGHAGYPHTVADPVLALAAIIVNLQQIPARRADPVTGAVCIVTEVHAGTSANIVPGTARARGTLRLMRTDDRATMSAALTSIVANTAIAYGCTAAVQVREGEPPLRNDATLAAGCADILTGAGYPVVDDFRSFGADDFAHYCEVVPSLMIFVGVDGPGLHDPLFVPPDETVRVVAHALLAGYLAAV